MITSKTKNIIFDLGGVIINLSVDETYKAFARLGNVPAEDIKSRVHATPFFREYEKGLISDDEFRDLVRSFLQADISNSELDCAWNAMLLDIPLERIRLLEQLRSNYKLFLLSNTNNIHLQCFNSQVMQLTGHETIDHYFDRAYYSHLVKMAKPDVEIYEHVVATSGLVPQETIFLDDNKDNLIGAGKAGIQTFHVENPNQLFSLF